MASSLISSTVRERLALGQFVPERQQREHPQGLFKHCLRLEHAVFTNRLADLLQVIDWLNDPAIPWVSLTGDFGMGKTSFCRALAECVPVENIIWLETPNDPDQFAAHLAKAFRQPDRNLFDTLKAIRSPQLVVINRADQLLTPAGRLQSAGHKPILEALLNNPNCRVVWSGQQPPPSQDLPLPVNLMLSALKKTDVAQLLQRVFSGVEASRQSALMSLTQGQPWRVRLLWRWLKQTPSAPQLQQVLGADTGLLEARMLEQLQPGWQTDALALLSVLSLSEHPLTAEQIQTGLKAAFPGVTVGVLPLLEQSQLTPFIKRVIPAQLAHHKNQTAKLALYQLAPTVKAWCQQQVLPWAQGQRALIALWQHTLDHPSTNQQLGTRWIRRTLQQLQQTAATPTVAATENHPAAASSRLSGLEGFPSVTTVQQQLRQAVQQGLVIQQLELLDLLTTLYIRNGQFAEATSTVHHSRSLAKLAEQPAWQEKASLQLKELGSTTQKDR